MSSGVKLFHSHDSFYSLKYAAQPLHHALDSAEYVKLAVAADQEGNFPAAFENYKIALDYFSTHLKYEKNPRAKETITQKVLHLPTTILE